MSIDSSQVGLVLQNGSVFFWGKFSQMGLCAEQLYKMFFSEKMKTHDFLKEHY